MSGNHGGIHYEPDDRTERRAQVGLEGAWLEFVRVPAVAHAFSRLSPRHLLMFTERGTRQDGESRADGRPVSTMRDTSGTFSLIPAGYAYAGWTEPTTPAEYLALSIDPKSPLIEHGPDLPAMYRQAELYRTDVPNEVRQTVAKLRRLMLRAERTDVLRSETLVSLLLQELDDWLRPTVRAQRMQGGLAPWQERRATGMLIEGLDGGIAIAEVARECGLSPGHFTHAFRRSMGQPPHRWLTTRRLEKAQELLRRTDLPLTEIALCCGFSGQSHFGRAFASALGESPGAWRRASHSSV